MGLLTVFAQNKGITMAMVEIRRGFSRKKDIIMVDTRHYMTFCKAPPSKIQQTKMLVTRQRFGDCFLFGLVWPYSSNQKNIMKVGSKSLLLTCSSNKL